jgi:hypothetical protein
MDPNSPVSMGSSSKCRNFWLVTELRDSRAARREDKGGTVPPPPTLSFRACDQGILLVLAISRLRRERVRFEITLGFEEGSTTRVAAFPSGLPSIALAPGGPVAAAAEEEEEEDAGAWCRSAPPSRPAVVVVVVCA